MNGKRAKALRRLAKQTAANSTVSVNPVALRRFYQWLKETYKAWGINGTKS